MSLERMVEMAKTQPKQLPQEEGETYKMGEAGQTAPMEMPEAMAAMGGYAASEAAPSLMPPSATAEEAFGAWLNNRRFTGLWSINQVRNAWVHVDGIGWKRLHHQSDSGIVALNMLAAHARQMNSPVNYREEADGMIYEIYVW